MIAWWQDLYIAVSVSGVLFHEPSNSEPQLAEAILIPRWPLAPRWPVPKGMYRHPPEG
jgi:hypothetical protein